MPAVPTASRRRVASATQLRATRRHILSCDGPGLAAAARHLGLSPGYLSQLLRGQRARQLTTEETRRLRALCHQTSVLTTPDDTSADLPATS